MAHAEVVGEAAEEEAPQTAFAKVAGEAGGCEVVVLQKGRVRIDVRAETLAQNQFGVRDGERGMERGAKAVLDAMVRPQRLPAVGRCYRLVGLCAGVRAGKGDVALRVPVLGEDYMIEACSERVDGGDDLVAARNG